MVRPGQGQWYADQMHGHGVLAHWAPAEGVLIYEASQKTESGSITCSLGGGLLLNSPLIEPVIGRVLRGPAMWEWISGSARGRGPLWNLAGEKSKLRSWV